MATEGECKIGAEVEGKTGTEPVVEGVVIGTAMEAGPAGTPAGATYIVAQSAEAQAALDRLAEENSRNFSMMFIQLGQNKRAGRFCVPKNITSMALFGGASMDFRRAEFVHPVTTIIATKVFGGGKIIVPRGVKVEISGLGIFGSFGGRFRDEDSTLSRLDNDFPTLKVTGLALFGGVGVVVDDHCPPVTVVRR